MMNPITALLARAAIQHSAFSRPQARRFGVTPSMLRSRVRRGDWPEVAPRVHVIAGSPVNWLRGLSVATLAPGGPVYASHGSAARLHRLDGFDNSEAIEVIAARGRRPGTSADVAVHWSRRLVPDSVTELNGIATLNLATTLVTIAAIYPRDMTQRALDDAVRRGVSTLWLRQTFVHHHHPGNGATTRLLEMLAEYEHGRPLPGSWFERVTERLLASRPDLPPLVRQVPVRRSDGRIALIDLGIPNLRVGLECQSRKYHAGPAKAHQDAVRSRRIDAVEDWDLLPVWWRDIDRIDEVARAFLAKIDRRRREIAGLAALEALDALQRAGVRLSDAASAPGHQRLTTT